MIIEIKSKYGDKEVIIDDEDYDLFLKYTWHISIFRNKHSSLFYVRGYSKTVDRRKKVLLHRILLNPDQSLYIDHINHNGLDNRKCNLRIVTRNQNNTNTRKFEGTSSYKGVYYRNEEYRKKRWSARIRTSAKTYFLGDFSTQEEAALAYNEAAKKYFGEYAYLNVIEETSHQTI